MLPLVMKGLMLLDRGDDDHDDEHHDRRDHDHDSGADEGRDRLPGQARAEPGLAFLPGFLRLAAWREATGGLGNPDRLGNVKRLIEWPAQVTHMASLGICRSARAGVL